MRRAVALLLALTALAAGCGGETESGPFATGDEPLGVELGPERTVEDGVVVRQVVYRSGEDRVSGYLVAPAAAGGDDVRDDRVALPAERLLGRCPGRW